MLGLTAPLPDREPRPRPLWLGSPRIRRRLRLIAVVILGLAGLGLADQAGWLDRLGRTVHGTTIALSRAAGLELQEALVFGRRHMPWEAVTRAVAVERGEPMLSLDLAALHGRLVASPWVRQATVERRLPDSLHIRLVERTPLALWQHGGRTRLIDHEGAVITGAGWADFPHLPMVAGADAPEHARAFLEQLETVRPIAARTAAAVRIGGRRWDLKLDNGVTVRLPETAPGAALERLAEIERQHRLLDRDIELVDLRLADRMTVRLSVAAASRLGAAERGT